MRTVTFSNPRLQQLLNQNFVSTYTNTEGDPTSGQSIRHRPDDPAGTCIRGNGKQNIQTIFLTPDGQIFHVATGYLSADDLKSEATFASQLFGQLRGSPDDKQEILVVDSHRDRAAAAGDPVDATRTELGQMMRSVSAPQTWQNAMSGRSSVADDLFRPFTLRQFQQDQQFSINHPLMNWQQLERDPTRLVGNGKSFFASSSSGSNR